LSWRITFKHSRNPSVQNAQADPMLQEVFQLLKSIERCFAQIDSSLNHRVTAVEKRLEVAHEKIDKVESRLENLETELDHQATELRKAYITHELRSKEFKLLFHGIPMKDESEIFETAEKIIRSFISYK